MQFNVTSRGRKFGDFRVEIDVASASPNDREMDRSSGDQTSSVHEGAKHFRIILTGFPGASREQSKRRVGWSGFPRNTLSRSARQIAGKGADNYSRRPQAALAEISAKIRCNRPRYWKCRVNLCEAIPILAESWLSPRRVDVRHFNRDKFIKDRGDPHAKVAGKLSDV